MLSRIMEFLRQLKAQPQMMQALIEPLDERLMHVERKQDLHNKEILARLAMIDGVISEATKTGDENKVCICDCRERLINIESKQDGNAHEFRSRLSNMEATLRGGTAGISQKNQKEDPFMDFRGSPDQGFGHLTYAQFGEDLIILNVFALLGITRPSYLDIGANHPLTGSNTALLYARGSRGVAVEANPHLLPLWRELRPGDLLLNVGVAPERGELPFHFIDDFSGRNTFSKEQADAFVENSPQFTVSKTERVKTVTINDVVDEHLDGTWPDFLTIDIEGLDYPVLKSAKFSNSMPKVLCVEFRDGDGKDISRPFLDLLPQLGYRLVFQTWGNLIAVNEATARLLGR